MGPWGNVPERMILRTRESLVVIQENDLTMAEAKTTCDKCGVMILQETADRTGGICMPCKNYLPDPDPADRSDEAVQQWIKSGRMISAIKLYREVHGCGLREGKDAVESLAEEITTR